MSETQYIVKHLHQESWMPNNGVLFSTPSLERAEEWAKGRVQKAPGRVLRISASTGRTLATVRTDWKGRVWVDLEYECERLL